MKKIAGFLLIFYSLLFSHSPVAKEQINQLEDSIKLANIELEPHFISLPPINGMIIGLGSIYVWVTSKVSRSNFQKSKKQAVSAVYFYQSYLKFIDALLFNIRPELVVPPLAAYSRKPP